ncbi:MAG: hypothetical protein OEY66_11740 [Gammaproteobacteria bacterium]|nr:hypothetical protein [Gammaproteobacteria bacterium]
MIKLTIVASNAFVAYTKFLPLLTFIILTSVPVDDSFAATRSRTTTTSGAISTDYHDHGVRVLCTWPNLEGQWTASTGDPISGDPISVSHSVQDPNNTEEYATCSGWNVFADGSTDVEYNEDGSINHAQNKYGSGKFLFDINYSSTATTTCIEDANSGIGNNCVKFTDLQNKKHGDGSTATPTGATLACADNYPGTTLTYQFFCSAGVEVTGELTLVPVLNGEAQVAPEFTNCGEARVADSACTLKYGGIPMKTVKIKGVPTEIVDVDACLAAFPEASVANAVGSTQLNLASNALLFYQETAYTGSCDSMTDLPTDQGSPTAAYGRYCTSDIDTFEDNTGDNVYPGDGLLATASPNIGIDGFDNELRVCEETNNNGPHTGGQDVDTAELADILVAGQPTLNLNCTTGDNTDSGKFKVWISDQAQLLVSSISTNPLSDAPTLEGVSPIKATVTNELGVDTLELVYPTCNALSAAVIENNSLDSSSNNSNVMLHLTGGNIQPTASSLNQTLNAEIEVKVNGL